MVDIAPVSRILRNPVSLTQRVANAAVWSGAGLFVGKSIALVSHTIVAWFLLPEAFGLIAVVTVVHAGIGMVSDIGIQQSVIRSERGEDTLFLRVAWTLRILRALILALLVLTVAGALAILGPSLAGPGTVYADPLLPGLVAASAVLPVVNALASANQMLARRRILLARIVLGGAVAQVVALAVKVSLVLTYPSVWVLFAGMVAAALTSAALSHFILPGPTMRLAWNRSCVSEFWHGGKWFIPASIFGFLARQGDKFLLAGLLDARTFGLYAVVMIWVMALTQVMQPLNRTVGVAALSEAERTSPERLKRVLRRYTLHFDAICVAVFALTFLFAPVLVGLVYTENYAPAGTLLQIFSFHYLAYRLRAYSAFMISTGRIRTFAMGPATEALFIGLVILVGFRTLGLPFEWTVFLIAISPMWTGMIGMVVAGRQGLIPLREELVRVAGTLAVMLAWMAALTAGLV